MGLLLLLALAALAAGSSGGAKKKIVRRDKAGDVYDAYVAELEQSGLPYADKVRAVVAFQKQHFTVEERAMLAAGPPGITSAAASWGLRHATGSNLGRKLRKAVWK